LYSYFSNVSMFKFNTLLKQECGIILETHVFSVAMKQTDTICVDLTHLSVCRWKTERPANWDGQTCWLLSDLCFEWLPAPSDICNGRRWKRNEYVNNYLLQQTRPWASRYKWQQFVWLFGLHNRDISVRVGGFE